MKQRLTKQLHNDYGDRKRPGTLSIIVDVERKLITPVPRDVEHVVFVARYLKITKDEFKANPSKAAKIIPVNFTILNEVVTGIATGISGMELGYGVRHTPEDLQEAHNLAIEFMANGELQVKVSRNQIIPL